MTRAAGAPPTKVILTPERYPAASAYELLVAAVLGHVAIDHRFLHALLDDPAKAIDDVARFVSTAHEEARIDLEDDLVNIARYLRAPELLPFLLDCVERYDDDVPDNVVEAVCGFREQALEPLLELNRRIGGREGCETPFLLASLGVPDERIEAVLKGLAERDPEEAAFCAEIYDELVRGTSDIVPYDIWEEYPVSAEPPFEMLPPQERLEMLSAESAELRAAAASSFFNEPDLPEAATRALAALAETDADPVVRAAAWRSLAIEYDDEELRGKMMARLEAADLPLAERAGLVVALAPEAAEGAVRKAVIDTFAAPETRSAAVEAMWRSGDRSFAEFVQEALDDADPDVREQGVMGVGYFGLVGELGRLKAMFDDPYLRPAALMGYSLALPGELSPARMRSLFKKIEQSAGGLEPEEADIVRLALDQRLAAAGKPQMFSSDG